MESTLSQVQEDKKSKNQAKLRNYSFKSSKRLPIEKMSEVNGIRIPSMPGSCYHAILCALAQNKDKFYSWERIYELTEKYICQYGGQGSWNKFCNKKNVKHYTQRIKDNTHTLTRRGKDCYGFRLHEMGMCIYFFKDGATLLTGGEFTRTDNDEYDVIFEDGRKLQTRYRGTTMTSKEYKNFLEAGYINQCGKIIDAEQIRKYRNSNNKSYKGEKCTQDESECSNNVMHVSITLHENYNQDTANRLKDIGLVVEQSLENEIIGTVNTGRVNDIKNDSDVLEVIVLS